MQKRYQIFVSSTFEDLREARQKVIESLLKLRCLPAVMEFFVASDDDQWSLIQRVIDDSDYYIVIVAAKYGSMIQEGEDAGMSYTEKEYRYAKAKGIPIYGFVHKNPEKLPMEKCDESGDKRIKLNAFRELVMSNKMVSFWETDEELGREVVQAISIAKEDKPRTGWVRGDAGLSETQVKRFFEMEEELTRLREKVSRQDTLQEKYEALPDMAKKIIRMVRKDTVKKICMSSGGEWFGFDLYDSEYGYVQVANSPILRAQLRQAIRCLFEDSFLERSTAYSGGVKTQHAIYAAGVKESFCISAEGYKLVVEQLPFDTKILDVAYGPPQI